MFLARVRIAVIGSIVVDEQNFDWQRWPTGAESWRNGTAFRGRGQHFRIELAPGTQMSRYLVSFNNPYLFDTNVSYGMSAYYFQRFYYDWYEQRMGGKVNLGYQFRPDLVGTVGVGAENVRIEDPRILIPDLQQVLGNNGRFSVQFAATNDTRDNTFFPTDGHYINLMYEQVTGSFTYPRVVLDMRRYFVLNQRADGSGRQVLALYSYTGVTGANTPIYDRFFLGGIGTIRGFYYRDASPTFDRWTSAVTSRATEPSNTPSRSPPTTCSAWPCSSTAVSTPAPRMSRADDIRVAPGMGIRISVPAMGPAPIAVDFAFPVVKNANDQNQLVNFAVGVAASPGAIPFRLARRTIGSLSPPGRRRPIASAGWGRRTGGATNRSCQNGPTSAQYRPPADSPSAAGACPPREPGFRRGRRGQKSH